jgi:sensor histidine kinase YesM
MSPPTATPHASWALFRLVARHSFSLESRNVGPAWMYWLVNGLFSTAVAIVLTALFVSSNSRNLLWLTFWQTWVISLCIGLSMQLFVDRAMRWAQPRGFARWPALTRTLYLVVAVMLAVLLGYTVGFALTGRNFLALVAKYPRFGVTQFVVAGMAVVTWFLISKAQTALLRREAEQAKAEAQAQVLQRQTADAELRALQAQIEPHFLFNTLANAIALVDYEPQQAKRLLEQFNEYLRATLSASRRVHTTLGDELQLLERYLVLMQLRMGSRLSYAIDVPEALRSLPFAPLLLQPLVENAIEHGLEPKVDGGRLVIRAERSGDEVSVQVQDTGLGAAARGSARQDKGVGLANVRERLLALWGPTARLDITLADTGCTASLHFQPKP